MVFKRDPLHGSRGGGLNGARSVTGFASSTTSHAHDELPSTWGFLSSQTQTKRFAFGRSLPYRESCGIVLGIALLWGLDGWTPAGYLRPSVWSLAFLCLVVGFPYGCGSKLNRGANRRGRSIFPLPRAGHFGIPGFFEPQPYDPLKTYLLKTQLFVTFWVTWAICL